MKEPGAALSATTRKSAMDVTLLLARKEWCWTISRHTSVLASSRERWRKFTGTATANRRKLVPVYPDAAALAAAEVVTVGAEGGSGGRRSRIPFVASASTSKLVSSTATLSSGRTWCQRSRAARSQRRGDATASPSSSPSSSTIDGPVGWCVVLPTLSATCPPLPPLAGGEGGLASASLLAPRLGIWRAKARQQLLPRSGSRRHSLCPARGARASSTARLGKPAASGSSLPPSPTRPRARAQRAQGYGHRGLGETIVLQSSR
eukprot:scaffold947_cov375-Prasinococcus_capsulatus_cf.AAC.19